MAFHEKEAFFSFYLFIFYMLKYAHVVYRTKIFSIEIHFMSNFVIKVSS